jgi:hypothetical protein
VLVVLLVVLLLVDRMVLLEDLRLVDLFLVDLLLRICIFGGQAFLRLVVLSIRMVCEWCVPFHLHLVDLVGRVLLPGIVLHRQHLHGP